jgi:6-phosphogluconolactonase
MPNIVIEDSTSELPSKIANSLYERLNSVVEKRGQATWCLAGGSTPMKVYELISNSGQRSVDWDKVNFLIGDERIVPENDPDSNWKNIYDVFLSKIPVNKTRLLAPLYFLKADEACRDYIDQLGRLMDSENRLVIDELWLGVGEDGHTLSLFPDHDFNSYKSLVTTVYDSPKPPPTRMSLTLSALENVKHCEVISLGEGKAESVKKIINQDINAPIYAAVKTIEIHGGNVEVIIDKDAARLI